VDGVKVDENGLNYVASGNSGVWIFSPDGDVVDQINVPGLATNVGWGEADLQTLFITTQTAVHRIGLDARGITRAGTGVAAHHDDTLPERFGIDAIYPNPFDPAATAVLSVLRAGEYDLGIYNVLGQEVERRRISAHAPGRVEITVDLGGFASGIYLFSVQGSGALESTFTKAVLVK